MWRPGPAPRQGPESAPSWNMWATELTSDGWTVPLVDKETRRYYRYKFDNYGGYKYQYWEPAVGENQAQHSPDGYGNSPTITPPTLLWQPPPPRPFVSVPMFIPGSNPEPGPIRPAESDRTFPISIRDYQGAEIHATGFFDTGADNLWIADRITNRLGLAIDFSNPVTATAANNERVRSQGKLRLNWRVGGGAKIHNDDFHVFSHSGVDVLFGWDFARKHPGLIGINTSMLNPLLAASQEETEAERQRRLLEEQEQQLGERASEDRRGEKRRRESVKRRGEPERRRR